ncbi:MAG TPA: hypothetical protein VNL38_02235 [Candidatus Nitrosotenuis sp.]|nr:hypothetical protein [Candidatus Nitrosotenuis sp.]
MSRAAAVSGAGADSRALNAQTSVKWFGILLLEVALLLLVFRQFRIEEPAFLLMACVVFAGFVIHYWLPFAAKEWFFVAFSVGGAFLLMEPLVAALLVTGGLLIFGIVSLPIAFGWRLGLMGVLFAGLLYGRGAGGFGLPTQFWPLFGALFMFRLMIYLYDLKHAKAKPGLREFLSYFYLLPNYYFMLFPVVDFSTMRRSRYQRNFHDIAQQGVEWMLRGTVQLLLYRLVHDLRGSSSPEAITSFGALAANLVLTFMLYLRVSGQFHLIVGMLHLFGYDLPETNRRYMLASSFLDLWRRINIYWKDFMVKVFYFPLYFKLRKGGELRAQLLATAFVFVSTWALHSYQYFWLRGEWLLTETDVLFWAILGLLVMGNVALEAKAGKKKPLAGWQGYALRAAKIAATFTVFVLLWSLWNAPSVRGWLDYLTWWKVG